MKTEQFIDKKLKSIRTFFDSQVLLMSNYLEEKKTLYLYFDKKGVYSYYPIDKDYHDRFVNADSQGKFVNDVIKNDGSLHVNREYKMGKTEYEFINEHKKRFIDKESDTEN